MCYQKIDRSRPPASTLDILLHNASLHPLSASYVESVKRRMLGLVISKGDKSRQTICGNEIDAEIVSTEPDQLCVKVNSNTVFNVVRKANSISLNHIEQKDIYLTGLMDMIQSSFDNSAAYQQLDIPVAKSVLMYGVAGVGKTRLVRRVSEAMNSTLYELSAHELLSFSDEEYDLAEFLNYNPLALTMNEAIINAPCIVMLKDLDLLEADKDKTKKIVELLSKEMKRIKDSEHIFIIGSARQIKSTPEALQKTEIFRQHMTLPIPTLPQRKVLLNQLLKGLHLQSTVSIQADDEDQLIEHYATQISMRTSGYVVRDLKLMIMQAKLKAMRSKQGIENQLAQLSLSDDKPIQWSDFEYALENYRPSQRAEVESTLPKRDWNDMGGYKVIKDRMKQAILLPLFKPEVFIKLGIKPPSGLLLYGPSGCGKTALVQALVSESMMNVISIKGPEIFSKYLGETENKLRKLFATAKRISPCIVFIDEMDAIGTKRGFDMGDSSGGVNERVLSTLLNEMDGVEGRQGVVVIGCTNRPDQIDDAILRPGRLDQLVYVGLPTLEDRVDIIKTLMKNLSVDTSIDPVALAKQTEFCSGADLENLFREAGTAALRKNINAECISDDHIQTVIIPICEKAEDQIMEGRLDVYEKFLHDHTL